MTAIEDISVVLGSASNIVDGTIRGENLIRYTNFDIEIKGEYAEMFSEIGRRFMPRCLGQPIAYKDFLRIIIGTGLNGLNALMEYDKDQQEAEKEFFDPSEVEMYIQARRKEE